MSIWILSTRMMPPIVIAVPLFWVMKKIHLVGTHLGLILIYVMIQLPFVIWMMKMRILYVVQLSLGEGYCEGH